MQLFIEDGLYDDYEFFKENIVECQSILDEIIQDTRDIFQNYCLDNNCSEHNKKKIQNNLYYLENIAKTFNQIKQDSDKVLFSCALDKPVQSFNNIYLFPLNNNDDIYVDLNNSISGSFYKDKNNEF